MADLSFCMSSFLAFRYVIDDNKEFSEKTHHQIYRLIPKEKKIKISSVQDIDTTLKEQFSLIDGKRLGILLSGGMDSACLAAYMPGCDAYTFRFLGGEYQKEELERAVYYAQKYGLRLHYVDISWHTVQDNLDAVMKQKGAPVHSIEPQILAAVKQAKNDGIDMMIIGDAADYVFGGMDGLYAKDWDFSEFVNRYIYVNPNDVLVHSQSMLPAFEKYRCGNKINYIDFMHEYTDIESYASYKNAFDAGGMPFLDPYEVMIMAENLDLNRIRNGESKYLIRELFRMKYPEMPVPTKLPMPRPVDEYFKHWEGPKHAEFKKNLDMTRFTGNQKWLMYSLERFLNWLECTE